MEISPVRSIVISASIYYVSLGSRVARVPIFVLEVLPILGAERLTSQ